MEIVRTIGRDSQNDIVLNKEGVADFHATLTFVAGDIMILEVLETGFETFVNNEKIQGRKLLKAQDIVCFGNAVFPFEEHYPQMLTYKNPEDNTIDLDSLIEEDSEDLNDEEKQTLYDKKGFQRWIYSLQFPKNRQQMQRIWILVISSIMLLTIVLPFLSWANPVEFSFIVNKENTSQSGIGMLLKLIDVDVSGAPMMYIFLQILTMLLILGVAVTSILFILYGATVWKLKNLIAIRRTSQVMLILFGLNFLFQFLRFVLYWYDGANVSVQNMMFTTDVSKSLIFAENLGIGFWLSVIGFILILRSTRNGLWNPKFSRRWASLSFSFWIPFVLLLALVHQGIGVVQTSVDVERYEDNFGLNRNIGFNDDLEVKSRICQGVPFIAAQTMSIVIREVKMEEAGMVDFDEMSDDSKQSRFAMRAFLIASYAIFILLIVMIFRKSIRGKVQFILSCLILVFSALLFMSVYQLLEISPGFGGDIIRRNVGIGCYIAILGGVAMLGEQFYFYTTRTVTGKEQRLLDDLQD